MDSMLVAMYLRISLDLKGDGLAIERQREALTELCKKKGWEWVEYVDSDKSATKGKRPAYQQMLQDIRDGKIQGVVVWDLDRLHRQPIELEEFINLADKYDLALASVDTSVDLSTDSGRLYARIKGAVARAEVERKGARQKASHEQAAKKGQWWGGGARPFGYDYDHSKGPRVPIIHPAEGPAIAQAYKDVLAGSSMHSIATQWLKAGLRGTLKGRALNASDVLRTLKNPRYAALRTYHGEIIGKGDWPAIVDRETWEAVQPLIGKGTPFGGKDIDRTRKALLNTILICGECGQTLGKNKRQGDKRWSYDVYRCKTPGCYKVSRRADQVEEMVREAMITALTNRTKAIAAQPDRKHELAEVHDELRIVEERMSAIALERANDEIDAAQFHVMNKALRERQAAAQKRLDAITERMLIDKAIDPGDIEGSWDRAPLDRKRAIMTRLCDGIVIKSCGKGRYSPIDMQVKWRESEVQAS